MCAKRRLQLSSCSRTISTLSRKKGLDVPFRRLGSLGVSEVLMRPLIAHDRRCAIVLGALTYTDRVYHTGLTQH